MNLDHLYTSGSVALLANAKRQTLVWDNHHFFVDGMDADRLEEFVTQLRAAKLARHGIGDAVKLLGQANVWIEDTKGNPYWPVEQP